MSAPNAPPEAQTVAANGFALIQAIDPQAVVHILAVRGEAEIGPLGMPYAGNFADGCKVHYPATSR